MSTMDNGVTTHSNKDKKEVSENMTSADSKNKQILNAKKSDNLETETVKAVSSLSAEVNLIDLNTPVNCNQTLTSDDQVLEISHSESAPLTDEGLSVSQMAHKGKDSARSNSNSQQGDMLTSHSESGYLTDSATTLSREQRASVGSESDMTPSQESLSSLNGLCVIKDSESSDEKTLDSLDNYGTASCSNFSRQSIDIADLDEFFNVNGSASRPESLTLPKPLQQYETSPSKGDPERPDRKRSKSSGFPIPRVKEGADISEECLSKSLPHGLIMKKGELIEFIADDLQEKIRQSSPLSKTESSELSSRTSSLRSINSQSSSASSTMATSFTSGMSRSPSSAFQQSPDTIPPIDPAAIEDLEIRSRQAADSLDLMMGNLRSNLHKMSAITVGCEEAYKTSVDVTCDAVDGSIKAMYALMAKCEELSTSMVPVYKLADQIKEIKRLLDRFEYQLQEKT